MNKLIILTVAILTSYITAYSQGDGYSATVVVVGNFQPTVSDATKVNFSPSIKDSIVTIPELTYFINSKKVETTFETEAIKPVKLVDEKLTKLYKYFAKAGFGTYKTPYAEFFYSNQRSRKWANNVRLKHISSTGKIDNAGFPGWSDNQAEANTTYFWRKTSLSGGAGFKRDLIHYYGYNPDSVYNEFGVNPSRKDIKQRFNYFNANARLANTGIDSSATDYYLRFDYHLTGDYYKRNENSFSLEGKISKNLELFSITKSQTIGIQAEGDYVSQKFTDRSTHGNSLISLKPFLNTKFGFFDINIGGNASITADSISYLYFYPHAELHFRLIRNILDFYGGYTGNIERHSYRSLSKENTFITSEIPTGFTYNKSVVYGGFNTRISKNMDFFAKVSNSISDNLHLFARDTAFADSTQRWMNRFTTRYDNARILRIGGGLVYNQSQKIRISIGGTMNNYFLDNEEQAWHTPPYEIYLSAKYNIQDKIIANLEAYYYASSWGLATGTYANSAMTAEKIKAYTDINLSLEYRYSKVLGGFISFNNIGASRYEKWLGYPSQRFSLMAGISYSF